MVRGGGDRARDVDALWWFVGASVAGSDTRFKAFGVGDEVLVGSSFRFVMVVVRVGVAAAVVLASGLVAGLLALARLAGVLADVGILAFPNGLPLELALLLPPVSPLDSLGC